MNDYISRKAVLSKCADIWDNADETTQTGVDTINTIDEITDFIESLPTADVQPVKHSKWVAKVTPAFYGFSSDGDPIYRDRQFYQCENCSRRSIIKENYCPRCGARMKQEG